MKRFWPARTKAKQQADDTPVADLDAIVAREVPFRFQGKIHKLTPMSLEKFLTYTNAQASIMRNLNGDSKITTAKDLAQLYYDVISAMCSTISLDDVMNMEQAQMAALYQLVIDMVTGQVDTGDETEKKKRLKISLYESVQVSSSQSVDESSDGPSSSH